MKLPKNGSALANSLLVAIGVLIGTSLTWLSHDSVSSNEAQQPGHPDPRSGPGLTPDSASADSAASPRFLIDSALGQVDPRARASLMRRAGASAARNDIADALRLGRNLESQQDRLDFHRGLFGVWADTDPIAALNHAHDNFTAGSLQSDTIGIVVNKWSADHPHEAWVWSDQNLTGPLKERALNDLMIGWTRRTPDLASKWLVDSGLTSQPLINAVARTWAEQDPRRAAAWAQTLPAGTQRQTAEVAVASEWARQDPVQAAAHFTDAALSEDGVNLAIALSDVWGTTDPAATADWISRLPSGASRDHAAGALATIWAASDITAAVAWGSTLTDPAMRRQVIAHLGTTWGAIEPLEAIDWLTGLPPQEAADGLTGALYSWAGTAPEQLRAWIDQAPPAEIGDQARLSLGDVLTSSDLPAAMELAIGMNSAERRDEALSRFFREWRRSDDPSAQDWIDANWSALSPESQQRLSHEQVRRVVPR